jgi:hypothetical protein
MPVGPTKRTIEVVRSHVERSKPAILAPARQHIQNQNPATATVKQADLQRLRPSLLNRICTDPTQQYEASLPSSCSGIFYQCLAGIKYTSVPSINKARPAERRMRSICSNLFSLFVAHIQEEAQEATQKEANEAQSCRNHAFPQHKT